MAKDNKTSKYLRLLKNEKLDINLIDLEEKDLKKMYTRITYLKILSKENLQISLLDLSDKEIKKLYLKSQKLKSYEFPYRISIKEDFEDTLKSGNLQYVTFKGIKNLRPLTLEEYFTLEKFVQENPTVYPSFRSID